MGWLLAIPSVIALSYIAYTWSRAREEATKRIDSRARSDMPVADITRAITISAARARAGCQGAAAGVVLVTIAGAAPVLDLADEVAPLPLAVMVAVVGAGICGAALAECRVVVRDVRTSGRARTASLSRRDLPSAIGADLLWVPWAMIAAAAVLCGVAVRQGVAPWTLAVVAVAVVAVTAGVSTATVMIIVRRPVRASGADELRLDDLTSRDTEQRLGEYMRQSGLLAMFFTYMLASDSPGWGMLVAVFIVFMGLATVYRLADRRRSSRERSAA